MIKAPSASLCLVEEQSDAGRVGLPDKFGYPTTQKSRNELKLCYLKELQISDSSEDFGAVHQCSRRGCAVILLLETEELAWAQWNKTLLKAFLFLFSQVISATIEHLFMVLGQIKTCTFFN